VRVRVRVCVRVCVFVCVCVCVCVNVPFLPVAFQRSTAVSLKTINDMLQFNSEKSLLHRFLL